MDPTAHRCPDCGRPICISCDMWGPYYLCEECGWTAEDDELLQSLSPSSPLLDSLTAATEAERRESSSEAA